MMKRMLKGTFLLVLAMHGMLYGGESSSTATQPEGRIFHYDFSVPQKLEYKSGAAVRNKGLHLDGINDFALIPNSGKFHFSGKGMTLAATVKLDYDPQSTKINDRLDMFFSKGKEFIFGKSGNKLYFNFHNGTSWCAATMTKEGVVPAPGTWAHVAATVEFVNDSAQGDVGYRISIYLNGEKQITKKFLYAVPVLTQDRIELGKGFGGGPWFMKGTFANASIYDRPLNAAAIEKLCRGEKRVKVIRKGFADPDPALIRAAGELRKSAGVLRKWFAGTVLRAASDHFDQKKLLALLRTGVKLSSVPEKEFTEKLTKAHPFIRFVRSGDLLAAVLTGQGSSSHPVVGVLDLQTGREIFGERPISFEISFRKGKTTGVIAGQDPEVNWNSSLKGNTLSILWKGKGDIPFRAESCLQFKGNRLESTFAVRNLSTYTFDAVKYPIYSFAHLGKGDTLVHPYMSGVEVASPTEEQFRHGQSGRFPSGTVSMQFGAYYNSARRGIYFGFEDGLARTKNYTVEGKRSNLNVSWEHPMVADPGKNHSTLNGKAVVELYQGSWYEAGEIYRRFLEKDAVWWIRDLPRKSTPEWFRNNTLWILFFTGTEKEAEDLKETFAYLRSYFELPFAVHWYQWSDDKYMGWPHYPIKDFTLRINRELRKHDIYTLPYIDTRLWKVKDGPGNTDYMYKSHGFKYASKTADGKAYHEKYGHDALFSIMCPYAKGWVDVMDTLVRRVESYGFNGVYHDQVATGRPRMCYDRSHGHLLNDPALWLEKGYWPMFERFFAYLHKKNRSFCHTTEENAEPYLKQFDGYLVWRWTDAGQIPLYQSIYSGRAQFVGRLYNHSRPGERQSFFSKLAQQLVNAEQLGWFNVPDIRSADERRLFVKKAMHLRKALLYYFNEGRMLKPLSFAKIRMEQPLWGGNDPQKVRMPAIANSAFRGKDGSEMYLFVNSQYKSREEAVVSALPAGKKGVWICREGASSPVYVKNPGRVKLAPLASEVWIRGSRERAVEIQKTLQRIAAFDKGKDAATVLKFAGKKSTGIPGKVYTAKDRSGNLYCNAAANNSHMGWIQDGAIIAYGNMDFGSSPAVTLSVQVAVDGAYAGGMIQFLTTAPGQKETVSAEIPLRSTGGWTSYKWITVPLKKPLSGNQQILFRIHGNAACNFKGWKYSVK